MLFFVRIAKSSTASWGKTDERGVAMVFHMAERTASSEPAYEAGLEGICLRILNVDDLE